MSTELECLEACPICGNTSIDESLNSNGFSIAECGNCGLLFVNPRPSEDSIRKLFSGEYIDSDDRVTEHFISYRSASLVREASVIKSILPAGGRLLDLGTASGAFLDCFTGESNWDVEGVEPSRYAAEAARKKFSVIVHNGFIHDQSFSDKTFDVITSLDAFFFHPNPCKDIVEISRILKPGGIFAVEIPGLNFRLVKNTGLSSRLFFGVPARLNAGVHLFFYNRKTLGRLLCDYGFEEIGSYPEQSPLYGNPITRLFNNLYYALSSLVYRISRGKLNLVPKEFIVFRKITK